MLLDFFLQKTRGKIIVVADIGTGSVACAVLWIPSKGPAITLAAARTTLPIEERTPQAAITAVAGELARVGKKVIVASTPNNGAPLHPEALVCIIRQPWTTAEVISESVRYEKDMPITATLISDLARKTLRRASSIDKSLFLDAAVIGVELNGYPTKKPEGARAHEITVAALISGCDPDVRAAIERSLENVFPHTPHFLQSSTRALHAVLREYATEHDYVVIDVGDERTAMAVVRDGSLAEQCLVPEGAYSILRRISTAVLPEETLSTLRMIAREECSSDVCETTLETLARIEPDLVKLFGEGMAKCAVARKLPATLYLIVHPDIAPWLAKFFSRIDFTQFTRTTQPYTVKTLALKDMEPWAVAAQGVRMDCRLAVAASLVNIQART